MTESTDVLEQSELLKSQEELRDLIARLELAELRNIELADQLRTQTVIREQVILDWRLKVDALNKTIADQAREHDRQLSEISADLIYFEGCLLRNKGRAKTALLKKDKKIREQQRQIEHQQKQINALNYANERLLSSLHGSRNADCEENEKRDSVSGYDSDETLCETEQFDTGEMNDGIVTRSTTNGLGDERAKNERNHSKIRENYKDLSPAKDYHKQSPSHVDNHVGSPVYDSNMTHVTPRSSARRRRKFSDVTNGYRTRTSSFEQSTFGTAPPISEKAHHRVRFRPDVNKIQEEPNETDTYDIGRAEVRLRKYSLPAYRLPLIIDDDADEEFI